MIRQYNPQRYRQLADGRRVGTIDVGHVFRLPSSPREPLIVTAWHNREYCGARRNSFMLGGHLAEVRSLRTGRSFRLADHWIRAASGDE